MINLVKIKISNYYDHKLNMRGTEKVIQMACNHKLNGLTKFEPTIFTG